MSGSYISRATSNPACNARIPVLLVRYAMILCPKSMVSFRCIEADVAMQQDIPSLQHAIYYSTKPLSAKQARSLGVENIDTSWRNRPHWIPANDWLPAGQKNTQTPTVEFSVFLPGFLLGVSTWSGHMETFSRSNGPEAHTEPATVYLTAAGLIVHYKKTLTAQHSARLTLPYMTNQELDSKTENHSTFKLER
ncbi:hypothetical protein [Pseudomonas alabamensis]|uniref:hypothetical protein n=1 Tax=Pseudomonas alabamensis TaxID=3064349 RepID=UPI000A7DD18B